MEYLESLYNFAIVVLSIYFVGIVMSFGVLTFARWFLKKTLDTVGIELFNTTLVVKRIENKVSKKNEKDKSLALQSEVESRTLH